MTDEVTTSNPEEIRRSLDEAKTDVDQPTPPAPVVPAPATPPAPTAPATPKVDRSMMSDNWKAAHPE
jgi:hypothetical protein